MLNSDGIGIGVEVRQSLVFGNPAAIHLVCQSELPSLVVDLDQNIFSKVLERDLLPEACADVPNFVGPRLEVHVVSDTALERYRIVFSAPRRLAAAGGIAAFPVLNDFCSSFQHPYFADARHITTVPFDAELEVLIRIEALRVCCEFGHSLLLRALSNDLSCDLLDLDHHEFRWLQRGKSHDDVHNSKIDIVLRSGLLVALDKIGVLRSLTLECALPKEVVHKGADIEPNLRP